MKQLNAGTAIIATLFIVSGAIYAGNIQGDLLQGTLVAQNQFSSFCGDGICENGEDQIICPSCAVDMNGRPMGNCPPCQMICEQDCSDDGYDGRGVGDHQCPDVECNQLPSNCEYRDSAFDHDCLVNCDEYECYETCGDGECNGSEDFMSCSDDCRPVCPSILCASPPSGCKYTPPYEENFSGCQVSCGELECDDKCYTVDCAAPPEGCRYEDPEFDGQCQVSCGKMKCEHECGNGVCEGDESLVVCIDPPFPCEGECRNRDWGCFPICKEDCGDGEPDVIQPIDQCARMFCPFGCRNGECLPPENNCNPIVCEDGRGHPRCTPEGHPINYFVDPCFMSSAPKHCEYNSVAYAPGESFKDADDCNTCFCGDDGSIACTEMYCGDTDDGYDDDDEVMCEGQYHVGDIFESSDGCNTCGCTETGDVVCTLMECDYGDPLEPDPGCRYFICADENGTYEVSACDAAGNEVQDPCGEPDDSDSDDSQSSSQETEYEEEVVTSPVMNRFSDVTNQTLEGEAANALAEKKIIGGFPDGSFRGGQPVNRAEAAKFLLMSRLGVQEGARNNNRFADVLEGEWYVKYVITAAERGIIEGYRDGTFRPAHTVNTAEFLKMLTGAFDLPQNIAFDFTDVPSDAWFARYAGVADAFNLFPGRPDGKLQPERLLTRGEVSIAIYRILNAE
jgi:hypothetical protein